MRRGYLLLLTALMSFGGMGLANCVSAPVEVEASKPVEHHEIVIPRTPTPVPERPNFDLSGLKICQKTSTLIPTATPEPTPEPTQEPEPAVEWVYYGNCRITHYDDCAECCGVAGNTTASGVYPTPHHTVATGEDLPFGTELLINGEVYVVEDRGVEPYQVDIFVEDHQSAVDMGMYYADVYVRSGKGDE